MKTYNEETLRSTAQNMCRVIPYYCTESVRCYTLLLHRMCTVLYLITAQNMYRVITYYCTEYVPCYNLLLHRICTVL